MKNSKGNKSAMQILKEGLEEKYHRSIPAAPIINYLIDKCEHDEGFSKRIVLENKSIKECFEYVLKEVLKRLNGSNMGWIDDSEVYAMAEEYYILDEVKIEKPKPVSIPKTKTNKVVAQTKKVEIKGKEQLSIFEF